MSTEVNQISGEFFPSQLFGLPNMYLKKYDFFYKIGMGEALIVWYTQSYQWPKLLYNPSHKRRRYAIGPCI